MSAEETRARVLSGCGGRQRVLAHLDVVGAHDAALAAASAEDRVVVFGSFHSVGDIMTARYPD
jgi:folylpolyglutamate synthase/dihydropteroate synthase